MKKLLLIAAMLVMALTGQAQQQAVTSTTAASTNNLLSVPSRIQQVIIANDTAAALVVRLFDAPSTNLTYTLSAYTNYLQYTTNIVSVYTTPAGVSQTNTNSGIFTYANTVSASTNDYRSLASISVAASSTFTYIPTNGLLVVFGLSSTNNTNCTITTTYSPAF